MPQLWTETIVTQYFWLIVILFGFYYFAVVKFIPQIAYTLKARRILEAAGVESKLVLSRSNNNLSSSSEQKSPRSLLSSILAPKLPAIKSEFEGSLKATISTTKLNWINKV